MKKPSKAIQSNPLRSKGGILWMLLLLLLVMLLALRFGSAWLDGRTFFGALRRAPGFETPTLILYSLRLPRMLAGLLAGVGLSVAGVLLQAVTGNPLASPSIIGVNAGAGFLVILFLCFFPAAVSLLPFAAFLGAFLTTLVILSVARRIDSSQATVILAGIAVQAILNAGISCISLLDADVLVSYNYFSIGGLSGIDANELVIPAAIILCALCLSLAFSREITLLCLGDAMAASLGVRVARLRMLCLICASAAAAGVVSFAGLLGFVGLIVPHIARRLVGGSVGWQLAASSLLGGILVLLADLLGRMLFAPSELPVGIVMAAVGAPFFLVLLLRRREVL